MILPYLDIGQFGPVAPIDYVLALLGVLCARNGIPGVFRPAFGGIVVGLLALVSLGSICRPCRLASQFLA